MVPGESYRKRKSWSGWDFVPVVWSSVPSPAHVHDEVMRDPGPLTNSGQMGRGFFPTITPQQRALEPVQLLLYGEKIITGSLQRILNQHCFTAQSTVWRMSLSSSAVLSAYFTDYCIVACCHISIETIMVSNVADRGSISYQSIIKFT